MVHNASRHLASLALLSLLAAACDDGAEPAGDAEADGGDPADVVDSNEPDGTGELPGEPSPADTTGDEAGDAERDVGPSIVEELAQRGAGRVGFRVEEVSYTPADREETRTLRLALWYPADEGGTQGTTYNGLVEAPDVFVDAPLAAGSERPLLVYSHGHLGFAEVSSFVAEHLVSHGWIVAAPDHTGNTTASFGSPRKTEIYYLRSYDISAVLDWLGSDDSGGINTQLSEDVVVAGHSFGGYTSLSLAGASYAIDTIAPQCADGTDTSEFCSTMTEEAAAIFAAGLRDQRIDAAILMAAGDFRLFGDTGVTAIDIPLLVLTGTADTDVANATNADPLWAALVNQSAWRIDLLDAPHNSFTTICAQELGVAFDCDPSSPLPAEWQRTVLVYASAFVRHVLTNDSSVLPVLNGDLLVSETAAPIPRP